MQLISLWMNEYSTYREYVQNPVVYPLPGPLKAVPNVSADPTKKRNLISSAYIGMRFDQIANKYTNKAMAVIP